MICDNWLCVGTWFGSGAGAAWVQALLTFMVFLYSVNSTKRTFREDQKRTRRIFSHERELERERQAKQDLKDEAARYKGFEDTLTYISLSLGFISGALKTTRTRAEKPETANVITFEYTIRNLEHTEEGMKLILQESMPTRATFVRIRTAIVIIHSAITFINLGKENPNEKLVEALNGVIEATNEINQQNERLLKRVRAVARKLKIESSHMAP